MTKLKGYIERLKDKDTSLTNIDLSFERVGFGDIATIVDLIEDNKQVKALNLTGVTIFQESAAVLANVDVEELNLTSANIDDEILIPLVTNDKIKKLDVSSNYISDTGAMALSYNNNIESLDISNNYLTRTSTLALPRMKSLKDLKLYGNEIRQDDIDLCMSRISEPKTVISVADCEHLDKKQKTV